MGQELLRHLPAYLRALVAALLLTAALALLGHALFGGSVDKAVQVTLLSVPVYLKLLLLIGLVLSIWQSRRQPFTTLRLLLLGGLPALVFAVTAAAASGTTSAADAGLGLSAAAAFAWVPATALGAWIYGRALPPGEGGGKAR